MRLKTLLLAVSFFESIAPFSCPQNSTQFPSENVCVYTETRGGTWSEAINVCANLKALPAKIQNIYENVYLTVLAEKEDTPPFIGVHKSNGVWTYADGRALTYQNWAPGEVNSTYDCAVLDSQNGQWRAADCNSTRPYFCTTTISDQLCYQGWVYSEKTNYCYYLQDFTYSDGQHWDLYYWSQAEQLCQEWDDNHLVSIHSVDEDDFLYDLIASNVANMKNVAPQNDSCTHQAALIGLYGRGPTGSGFWTDQTPVNYTGSTDDYFHPHFWTISNDRSCHVKKWSADTGVNAFARYICKMPSKKTNEKENID